MTGPNPSPPYRPVQCPTCLFRIAVDNRGRFWAHGTRWSCSESGKPAPLDPSLSAPTAQQGTDPDVAG